jgi:hypothetical protein
MRVCHGGCQVWCQGGTPWLTHGSAAAASHMQRAARMLAETGYIGIDGCALTLRWHQEHRVLCWPAMQAWIHACAMT